MIPAKKYEPVSKFVKVMPKKLWLLFSGHGVHVQSTDYLNLYRHHTVVHKKQDIT